MSVAFDEYTDSPRASFQGLQFQLIRRGQTVWTDIEAFEQELMPPTITFGTSAGQFYGAAFPGRSRFHVTAFQWVPFGAQTSTDSDGMPVYARAEWTITYQIPTFGDNDNPEQDPVGFLTHEWDGGGEFLSLPNLTVSWDAPSLSVRNIATDAHAGIFIPTIEHSVTWDRVKSPPFETIRSMLGKVNDSDFELRTGIATTETLMFLGPKLRQVVMTDGARAWRVTYKFSERRVPAEDQTTPGGWNHFWRDTPKNSSGFYKLYKSRSSAGVTGSYLTYETGDFSTLFETAPPDGG